MSKISAIWLCSIALLLSPTILPTTIDAVKPELDTHIHFIENESRIQLVDQHRNRYVTRIESFSKTNLPTYARQDVTLVYDHGILQKIASNPIANTDLLQQTLAWKSKDSSRIDVITLHMAEIHDFDENITHQYAVSEDQLYLFKKALSSSFSSFREPATNTEKEWKRILDRGIEHAWQNRKQKIIQHLGIQKEKYHWLTLNELPAYEDMPLPSFSEYETRHILFQIWQHVYQVYMQGELRGDDRLQQTTRASLGSTIPFIGLAKDGSYIRVLYMTEGGKSVHVQRTIQLP